MSEYAKPALDSLQGLLGYVNFSAGKPDARFQKQMNDVYAALASQGSAAVAGFVYGIARRP